MYCLYLKSGQDWEKCKDEYGYYSGEMYTYQYTPYPICDKKITLRTKGYSTKKRAENALEAIINKCLYVSSNSKIIEIPDKKKTIWAIFKDEYGLYAKEYINSIEKVKDTIYGHYINDKDTPFVINRAGGRTVFDDKDKDFVEFRESETFPLTRKDMFPKNLDDFHYGWIDLEGNTYACSFRDHSYAAEFLCEEMGYNSHYAERQLENLGWIKISREAPYTPDNINSQYPYIMTDTITKKQADTLFDLNLYNDWRIKHIIEESEKTW